MSNRQTTPHFLIYAYFEMVYYMLHNALKIVESIPISEGMIYGLLKKCKAQNTLQEDFKVLCKALFERFLVRGYRSSTLQPLFQNASQRLALQDPHRSQKAAATIGWIPQKVFHKIPYDPNGPSRSQIRAILALDDLSKALSEADNIKITICN